VSTGLGSARASRAGDAALVIANFCPVMRPGKVRFGESPKPAREARALPASAKIDSNAPTPVFQQSPMEYQWPNKASNAPLVFLIDDLLEHFPMRDIWTFMIKRGIPGTIWI